MIDEGDPILKILVLALILILPSMGFAEGLPHLGVRYTYDRTPVFSVDNPQQQLSDLPAHTAVIPCVIMKNGNPLTGPQGQVLLGFEEVYREPMSSLSSPTDPGVTQAHQTIQQQRAKLLTQLKAVQNEYSGKKITSMDCGKNVKRAVLLDALNPTFRNVAYSPPVSAEFKIRQALDLAKKLTKPDCCKSEIKTVAPLDLVKEFHNSNYCLQTELSVGKRKAQLLKNWDAFIRAKTSKDPQLKAELEKAKAIDIATRTAIFEGSQARGCSEMGVCERDTILLSLRNRAQDPDCKKYDCAYVGDIPGVATSESQYNIWSDFYSDVSYMTSCFLREDLNPANPASNQVNWTKAGVNKEFYQKLIVMFEGTSKNAEKILYASDKDLQNYFKADVATDIKTTWNYYHPPAMSPCYPQIPDLRYVTDAYVQYKEHFIPIRKEYIKLSEKNPGEFDRMVVDVKNPNDPIDDTINFTADFAGAVINPERAKPYLAGAQCSVYGISPDCESSGKKYYRLYPKWLSLGHFAKLDCLNSEIKGVQCTDTAQNIPEVIMGDKCNRLFSPVAGVP